MRNALKGSDWCRRTALTRSVWKDKVRKQTRQIKATLTRLRHSYDDTLTSLAKALDTREKEVGFHSERVRRYTLALAGELNVPEPLLSEMARGALLHDIGKIGIPDKILLKPGRLDEAEWREMRRHPQRGFDIIADIGFLSESAKIVLNHHESFSGEGYPRGLKGEEIPLGARIFSVIDTLDAMTSDRPYRKALSFETAEEEIKRCSDTEFDPRVVRAFLAVPRRVWEEIARGPL